ncbi:hypothetical protein THAOC_01289 [Thalassiosira oceanica]|uniref:Leucine-rich repeat domain-containing protein n=1 Tax=Thalassiosira oceanica TaxID=159749 RepID=K0THI9_THAOC|nr:hypothetical protein THAOC_01289 [Thalassiosira oceanica]|eukprot:EJK76920.1 hypothetical protein THAOC_01289 [Thalassiosira oceanica]
MGADITTNRQQGSASGPRTTVDLDPKAPKTYKTKTTSRLQDMQSSVTHHVLPTVTPSEKNPPRPDHTYKKSEESIRAAILPSKQAKPAIESRPFSNSRAFICINMHVGSIYYSGGEISDELRSTIKHIHVGTQVGEIPNNETFEDCGNLTEVQFAREGALKVIGKDAFRNCTALQRMSLPPSVTELVDEAFRGCRNLTDVQFAP